MLIHRNGWLIPGEHVPFQTAAALFDRNLRQPGQEGATDAVPPRGRRDVEVFKPDAMVAEPCAVTREKERTPYRR